VDPYYDKVFCYIARNHETKQLECHAFLCSKKSKAEAITLTVAQAFNIAYEKWQAHKKRKESGKQSDVAGPGEVTNGQVPQPSGGTEEVDIGIGDVLSSPPQSLLATQPEQKQPSPKPLQPFAQPSSLLPLGATDTAAGDTSSTSIGVTPASPPYTQPQVRKTMSGI